MSRRYKDSMLASGRASSEAFPHLNPAISGDFWDNCKDDVDSYLYNYMIDEFYKKDIRFRIPTLDVLAKELCLVGSRRQIQDIYKEHFDEHYEFAVDEGTLEKIPEDTMIAQCFLMSVPMYLLYDNKKGKKFDKELYTCDLSFVKSLITDFSDDEALGTFDVVAGENLKGNLVGLRLFIDEALDRFGEYHPFKEGPADFQWEVWSDFDGGYEKLSTGYRPGEKNRLGYFVPEPVISILKDKYLLGISFDSDILPVQFDRNEMFNWVADIVFIDFVNEKTYGKKCKARVLLNSIDGVYPNYDDPHNRPHLEDYEKSYVKFTTESGKKITVDLFGLQEIHKLYRVS